MRTAITALALVAGLSPAAHAQSQFGETCHGSETVQVDAGAPRPAPYDLKFSVDLNSGYYCYADCTKDQTFAIKGATADRIRLADFHGASQVREIVFDRKTATLTDYQVIRALGTVTRRAEARCTPAPFQEPPMLGGR